MSRPLAVAITGGIGAGKSTALESFRRHGAATVSSDEIVHHLLRTDPDVKRALVERFGEEILDSEGVPDRERIGFRVFRDRDALDWLEKLLHPLVSREYLQWREQLAALPSPPAVCVTEVPLLYEVGGRVPLRQGRGDHRAAASSGRRGAAAGRTTASRAFSPTRRRRSAVTSSTSTPERRTSSTPGWRV